MEKLNIINPEAIAETKSELLLQTVGEGVAVAENANPLELAKAFAKGFADAEYPEDLDDKKGYNETDEKRKQLGRKRRAIAKIATEFTDKAKKEIEKVNTFSQMLIAPISEQELRLKNSQAHFKKRQDEREAERERLRIEQFNARTSDLIKNDCVFRGEYYESTSGLKISIDRMHTATPSEWTAIAEKIESALIEKKAAEEAEAQRAAEERARLKAIEDENKRLREQLEALQAKAAPKVESKPTQNDPPKPSASKPEKKATATASTPKQETSRLSPSEENLELLGGQGSPNFSHFKNGYLKGVAFAKEYALKALEEAKNRGELKSKLNAL